MTSGSAGTGTVPGAFSTSAPSRCSSSVLDSAPDARRTRRGGDLCARRGGDLCVRNTAPMLTRQKADVRKADSEAVALWRVHEPSSRQQRHARDRVGALSPLRSRVWVVEQRREAEVRGGLSGWSDML